MSLDQSVEQPAKPKYKENKLLSAGSILRDFEICCISREASLLARREVLTGKAKFGITGDGKEVPQVAMAHAFQKGDFRAGYYRDQTLILALDLAKVEALFAQLYADADHDPFSGGRQMNSHFATPLIDKNGNWTKHTTTYNISADVSSTAGQMARALGLALASKKYREIPDTGKERYLSDQGNEVVFCTIGDASTSEGVFWETINAAGVMQVPLVVSVWDDGYGISVPKKYQTTKGSISEVLKGFQAGAAVKGVEILRVKGWDYPALVKTYLDAVEKARKNHTPVLIHVEELTQPQGHSTSGSHERYKSKERLAWEKEYDCLAQMEKWIIAEGYATEAELGNIRKRTKIKVKEKRDQAWKAFNHLTRQKTGELRQIYQEIPDDTQTEALKKKLQSITHPVLSELLQNARRMAFLLTRTGLPAEEKLKQYISGLNNEGFQRYHTNLYSSSPKAALKAPVVEPTYSDQSPLKNGYEILNTFFDKKFRERNDLIAFGEDLGKIGDVNQGFAGLQNKFGIERIFDTGIREWTIIGQAIGLSMRGWRPIAEIQYLDYLIYGLEPLTDDLATLRYRSNGIQHAPAIIRTRGHRLEGIWHTGSPLGMLLNALRGMYVLVPRDMTRAAGFYNTLLQSDDPALVIECLNGYRLKERMPDNIGAFSVPLGVPEVLQEGTDITLVTYGSCVRVALEAISWLERKGISVELVDVQSLLPFDLEHRILASIKKTNRVLFLDEDVPGGATAYMLQKVVEEQGAFRYLDSPPVTLTAKAHRTPYGSDGDYFTKPNAEDIMDTIYQILYEAEPGRF